MAFWKSAVPVALVLGATFFAHPAQSFPVPVPAVQQDAEVSDKTFIPIDKLLSLSALQGTGRIELGESRKAAEIARQTQRDVQCLAQAMYFEARGEPSRGQYIVGRVILNRVSSRYYPDSVCDVVYQNAHMKNRCQFSFACDGIPNRITEKDAWREIERRAEYLVSCDDSCFASPVGRTELWTSTHYHADYVNPGWAKKLHRTGQIGSHIFYYTSTM